MHTHTPVNIHLFGLLIYKHKPQCPFPSIQAAQQRGQGQHGSYGYTNTCHGSKLRVINIPLNKGEGTSGYPMHSHTHTLVGNSILSLFYGPNSALWMTETPDLHSNPIPLAMCVCMFVCVYLSLSAGFIYLSMLSQQDEGMLNGDMLN